MGVIAKYKFDQNIYANFIPEFNSEFTNYTITDEIGTDGYTIRTLGNNSGNLPTLMRFGQTWTSGESDATDKSKSLLEVYECDTSNITNMNDMFRYCNNLISLVASNFNTNKVTGMSQMFQNCTSLASLDLSNFNTSQVSNMGYMFQNCSSLTSLNVSNFNTQNVINMVNMFTNCSKLTSLDVSNFNTEKVASMIGMFNNCSSLTSLDVSNFNTSQVTTMNSMFNKCSSLTSLDISNFNTSQVTNMNNMFYNCSSLTSLDVSNFDTSKVTDMNSMFYHCDNLTSLDLSSFNTEKVANMSRMFSNCLNLISLNLSSFNTEKVADIRNMFYNCSKLTSLDLSNFNTENVSNMGQMFQDCSSLTSLDLSNFNTENVSNMGQMFQDCSSLTSLDVSNFNTENVSNMGQMFQDCSSLTSLDLSNWSTNSLTNIGQMFFGCSNLEFFDISNFNINDNVGTPSVFVDCSNVSNIGMVYCNSSTINKISDLITTDTTIYYMDAKLEDLTKKENITYKEYKMNILESDEEIVLRRIGDVCDELNLETGELTQRIGKIVLNGSETIIEWENTNVIDGIKTFSFRNCADNNTANVNSLSDAYITYQNPGKLNMASGEGVSININHCYLKILTSKLETSDIDGLKKYLSQNPITVQYELETPIIKTVNSEGKPSINWQGDTYIHLENNTLYPQLDCEVESINYYEIPKLKANTLYTLRYIGEPTQCIFGGLTYKTENNMILTSGSSDNLLYFDKEVRKVVLIEGDVRDRNFDYFEGIESLGAVEIVTHKSNMPIFAKGGRK